MIANKNWIGDFKTRQWLAPMLLLCLFSSCRKTFLDAIPNNSLSLATNLQALQAVLDNNIYQQNPALADVSSDDYYVATSVFNSQTYYLQNCYDWASNTYGGGAGTSIFDWQYPYNNIYQTNVVLDNLPNIPVNSTN